MLRMHTVLKPQLLLLALCLITVVHCQVDILNITTSTCAGSLNAPYNASILNTYRNWTRADNFFYFMNTRFNYRVPAGYNTLNWTTDLYACKLISNLSTLPTPISDVDWSTLITTALGNYFFLGMTIVRYGVNKTALKPDNQWYWLDGRSVDWGDAAMRNNIDPIYLTDTSTGTRNYTKVYIGSTINLQDRPYNEASYFHCQMRGKVQFFAPLFDSFSSPRLYS
jgi:hypothetical protein